MPKKISVLTTVILLCVFLSGCASMIPLTAEEEEEIAIYTSSLISKYNRNQTNGLTYISEQRRLEVEAEKASYHPALESTDETADEEDEFDEFDELNSDLATDGQAGTDDFEQPTDVAITGDAITLSDLVGRNGITVTYQGSSTATHYVYEDVLDFSPRRGYQFLVMNFQLKNTSSDAISIDLGDSECVYYATVNGVTAGADQDIAFDDLASFEGTIPAGGTQNLVLLFQYQPDTLSDLSNLSLRVDQGDHSFTVVL